MFWKDNLSVKLLSRDAWTYAALVALQQDFPSLRVKTADANGRIPVIQLEEKGQWMKPKEWAVNHQASLKQRLLESQRRVLDATGDPSVLLSSVRSLLCPADCHFPEDLSEIARLESELQTATETAENYAQWRQKALQIMENWGQFLEHVMTGGEWPDDFDYDQWIDQFHGHKFKRLPEQSSDQHSQGSEPHQAE